MDGTFWAPAGRALRELPDALIVTGNCVLAGCASIDRLPAMTRIGGSLSLRGCSGLSRLPEGIQVGGFLDLQGTKVRSMPAKHSVGGYQVGQVTVPEDVYWRPHELTFERIMALGSLETRRIAVERLGWELLLHRAGGYCQVLDADPDPLVGTLIRLHVPGETEPYCLLRVRCATLPRHYVLRVPPSCGTAAEGNAWTWGLAASEYRPDEQA